MLIIDESDFDYYELFKEGIYLKLENGDRDYIEGEFEYKCKGSDLTEKIASELCHNIGNSLTIEGDAYLDDVSDLYLWEYATDAIITSVESGQN